MTKVIYTAEGAGVGWADVLPWRIARSLLTHRELIASIARRDIHATYRASYLGLAWQILLPAIMLSIFYLVFGEILGGRFSTQKVESPMEYALALFVGLGFFNTVAQNIGNATSLIVAHSAYVKTLSFPLEILSVTSVLVSMLNLCIGLALCVLAMPVALGDLHASAVCAFFYLGCVYLLSLGLSWTISAIAVFVRDVAAITSPLTLVLMFMCPIFYPLSLVPEKIRWVVEGNPLAILIEDARGSIIYGIWPSPSSALIVLGASVGIAMLGYFVFMRLKAAFADLV